MLDEYSADESCHGISEDRHFGPYDYLKFMTWDKPFIAKREICGRPSDFYRLSEIIKKKLTESESEFEIDKEYSNENEYTIKFIIKDDNFEPARADLQLTDYWKFVDNPCPPP